jgi:carbamoyltransferase
MKILGISAFYHDAAAAIIVDGKIIGAAQEERFSRIKHDPSFPIEAISYCLKEAEISIDELDAIAFYDKPLLKFERLLETQSAFVPRGAAAFARSMPVWIKEKMFLKGQVRKGLKKVEKYDKKKLKLLFPEHHLSHAASTFYPSPFKSAAILTIDGVGEWATASICKGDGGKITSLKEMRFPHSVGLLYSAFTYFIGFKVNSGEYKLMGLAPYGNHNSKEVNTFKETIKKQLIEIKPDGSIWLDQKYFRYATGDRMANDKKWERLFGFPRRKAESKTEQKHCNLALAIQEVTEEIVLKMAQTAKELTGSDYLCMAGGVALNCVANGKLKAAGIFKDIFIQPAAGDAGGALGAALAAHHLYFEAERIPQSNSINNSLLGPAIQQDEIASIIERFGAKAETFDDTKNLCTATAKLINKGQVIGWVQGRMEFGPRALGNRSIVGDPRNKAMQRKLNEKIKKRENFRPFAPAVIEEDAQHYFEMEGTSPYMLMVHQIAANISKPLSENQSDLSIMEQLDLDRSTLPAITHVDYSARIQTVNSETHPKFYQLLQAFKAETECSVLINTSFNLRGEPIVNTAEDAYRCFMHCDMDYLVIDNFLFAKKDQPKWTGEAVKQLDD